MVDTSQWKGNRKSNSVSTENGSTAISNTSPERGNGQSGDDESRAKNKSAVPSSSKRRNTLSAHLEQQKVHKEHQQQALAQAMAGTLVSQNGGVIFGGLPGEFHFTVAVLIISQ